MTRYEELTKFIDALTATAKQKIERAQAISREADTLLLSAQNDIESAERMHVEKVNMTLEEAAEEV